MRRREQHFYATLGRNIRDLRESRHMTQELLSSKIPLTRTSISNIEAGRQRVPLHVLSSIRAALNTSWLRLLRGTRTEL